MAIRAEESVWFQVRDIEQRRAVRFHLGKNAAAAVGHVDPYIKAALQAAVLTQGYYVLPINSPASHDAAAVGEAGVRVGMLFVRNANGSHNPYEAMSIEDFLDGVVILTQWLATEANRLLNETSEPPPCATWSQR